MGYSKSELVKFRQYFSYSLEQRIRPRFALVKEVGVKIPLSSMLALSFPHFEKVLKMNRKIILVDKVSTFNFQVIQSTYYREYDLLSGTNV
ncbi:hypothetical protein Pint_26855 [Pistacia integerrima]|uniref:Uncharacterized protein n=1 Tax=Pistacia integerrima TaxID=434235 RepID=A0ACC0YUN3_9ROSI|nr:hypothetical protein Pint_26855 [Pistacia integerrima]